MTVRNRHRRKKRNIVNEKKIFLEITDLIYCLAVRYSFYFSDACLVPICFTSAADFPQKFREHEANRWQQLRDFCLSRNFSAGNPFYGYIFISIYARRIFNSKYKTSFTKIFTFKYFLASFFVLFTVFICYLHSTVYTFIYHLIKKKFFQQLFCR